MKEKVRRRWYTFGWLLLGAGAILLEAIALTNKLEGDTLTEHVRRFLKLNRWLWRVSLAASILGGIWLIRHFWFDKKI